MKRLSLWLALAIFLLSLFGCVSAKNNPGNKTFSEAAGVDLSRYDNVYIGYLDLNADSWDVYNYEDKQSWVQAIEHLTATFQAQIKKNLATKNVLMQSNKEETPQGKSGLYIKFEKVFIDQFEYKLYATIDFIDLETNAKLYTVPHISFYGNEYGFENMLNATLIELAKFLKKELNIPDPKIVYVDPTDSSWRRRVHTGTFDLSHYKNITIGLIDLHEDDWALWRYGNKRAWADVIRYMNEAFFKKCKENMSLKNVTAPVDKNDSASGEPGLLVAFTDVEIEYESSSLTGIIHFIDTKSQAEVAKTPLLRFQKKDYGFERYLKNVLDLVASQIVLELSL
jgi:hypothetical protein